ncbi:hypothetical protein [Peribacillus deserti]|uniref:Uncharacterized protein n=1 Tax=Peribacillus deserti TaxID=673318 RepID=A0A2N5LZH5_9BACI|nr:hypothetical protein [Peribacillus deserti]PLT27512.1 hypothetical protein CUU66_23485 [Peribacillus deserti]
MGKRKNKALVYSTGPMENATAGPDFPTQSTSVITHVLNNHEHKTIIALIRVFMLDGTKTLIDEATLTISPNSNAFRVSNVSNALTFEVQIQIFPSIDSDDVLISSFGRDAAGNLNPSHRVVHKELTRIDELTSN